ncbi:MAG: hypothetical protein KC620_25755, partial [Myxococcales bacterium]|nr:hypothetical protein [Myxococcales bacterium]
PTLPPNAEHLSVPPFGTAVFFNDEIITADTDDSFSYCETGAYPGVVFRPPGAPLPLPLLALPAWHAMTGADTYGLGVVLDFPYIVISRYEIVGAIAVSAFTVSLPFGVGVEVSQDFGSELWLSGEFPLADTLLQCRRFCGHPTFDGAGVYQVGDRFDIAYQSACYAPAFPKRGDSGFPRDP